jgi:hypothetical protein
MGGLKASIVRRHRVIIVLPRASASRRSARRSSLGGGDV